MFASPPLNGSHLVDYFSLWLSYVMLMEYKNSLDFYFSKRTSKIFSKGFCSDYDFLLGVMSSICPFSLIPSLSLAR